MRCMRMVTFTLVAAILVASTSIALPAQEHAGMFSMTYPTLHWSSGSNYTSTSLFDSTANVGYFTDWVRSPNSLFKVDLGTMTELATLNLTTPTYLNAAVMNPTAHVAIFGGYYSNMFTKVDLTTFSQNGTLTLSSSLHFPGTYSEAYDPNTQMAYFGSNSGGSSVKGQIVKIDTSKFVFVSSIPLLAGEAVINFLLLDPSREMLYAGIVKQNNTTELVSVNLTTGTRIAGLGLPPAYIDWGVIDTANNLAYVASYGTPTTLYKVNLSTFTITASIPLSAPVISAGVIDIKNQLAFFGSSNNSCDVSEVDLGTFAEVNSFSMTCNPFKKGDNSQGIYTQFLDTTNRIVYWGIDTSPGSVIKMAY